MGPCEGLHQGKVGVALRVVHREFRLEIGKDEGIGKLHGRSQQGDVRAGENQPFLKEDADHYEKKVLQGQVGKGQGCSPPRPFELGDVFAGQLVDDL